MLAPKRTKFRKQHRGRMKGKSRGATYIAFGEYGLQALEPKWITDRQIEAVRICVTRYLRRGGKIWLRVFPDKPVTKKPAETRMGKGKGDHSHWVAVVKPGRILVELTGTTESIANEALTAAASKLPIRTRILKRGETSR